jgi:predicted RNA binding protein YcfA (HicA-like mRNA interferase family)
MTRLAKRIEKIERNPKNVSSDELISVLISLGFERSGGKGGHQCYKHPSLSHIKLTIPKQNPLRRAYVIQALNAVHQLLEETEPAEELEQSNEEGTKDE